MATTDGSAPAPVLDVEQAGRTPLRLLLGPPLVIGRDCEGLILDDPQISRRHLEVRVTTRGVEITDLGSTNGTFVDGERVDGTIAIGPGATVRLGAVTLRITTLDHGAVRRPATTLTVGDVRRTSMDRVAELVAEQPARPTDGGHRHGTITIVFSDIESSTSLATSLGDARWYRLLEDHNQIVVEAVRQHGGTVVKNQGDGFMLTFPSARRALQAMISAQNQLQGITIPGSEAALRIRVGLHTGEAIVDDDGDLFGSHVNMAARVGGVAAGGEIVVSALTRAILETRGDLVFEEPRQVELKGMPGTHVVHPVRWLQRPADDATGQDEPSMT